MDELGYGHGYQYAHDTAEKLTRMPCLPDSLADARYYTPDGEGQEAAIRQRLDEILTWKAESGPAVGGPAVGRPAANNND